MGIAAELHVFFGDGLRGTTQFHIWTVGIVNAVGTAATATATIARAAARAAVTVAVAILVIVVVISGSGESHFKPSSKYGYASTRGGHEQKPVELDSEHVILVDVCPAQSTFIVDISKIAFA
jgi:hypothetical protein